MKKVIVTGATGAIGIALINELAAIGIEVLVFARAGSKRNARIPRNQYVSIKNCSLEDLQNVENDTGKEYDAFFHLAWAGTNGSGRNDMYLQNENVRYALDAVGAAKRFGCKIFIGTGSQAEYGCANKELTSETAVWPNMGYGYAKLCAGLMTRDYAHQLGMKHIWSRILSVYGPFDGENSMIMSVIDKMKSGETVKLTKGEQQWDYLYSEDAARALILLAKQGTDGKTYVVGSGTTCSIREYVESIRNIMTFPCKIEYGAVPYAKNQIMFLCADISEIQKDTDWQPVTDFESGIKKTIEWVKERDRQHEV